MPELTLDRPTGEVITAEQNARSEAALLEADITEAGASSALQAILTRIRDIGRSGYDMPQSVQRYFQDHTSPHEAVLADSIRYVQNGQYVIHEYTGPIGEALDVYFRFFPHPNGFRPRSTRNTNREETATPNNFDIDLDVAKVVLARPDAEYLSRLREAVTFLRRNSSRRYSDSTIGSLMRKVDVCEERISTGDNGSAFFDADYRMPTLLIVEDEPGYDEETEVKTGGMLGVALIIPSLDESPAKLLMAVKEARRREGVGTKLMDGFRQVMPTYNTVTYLSNTNTVGLLFAVDAGFVPAELTPNGVMQLRYEECRRRAERE